MRQQPTFDGRRGPAAGLALAALIAATLLAAPAAGQTPGGEATPGPAAGAPGADLDALSGRIVVDGSSTVWPVTIEIAERFAALAEGVQIEVEVSGTGGGFRRFCDAASDVQNASRPITADEAAECAAAGVAYQEFAIGFDGITVVVNPENGFVDCLTSDQLRRLWQADDPARRWRDLDPAWPDDEIDLYGPGTDSGTYDFFAGAILAEGSDARDDYTPSENDFVLVEGVATDADALGYFGYAYFLDTQDRLKAVAVDAGGGCVLPSPQTIADSSYPLARPIFVYVARSELARPEVAAFMRFYLATVEEVVQAVGYAPSDAATYAADRTELEGAIAGNVPADGPDAAATPAP